MRLTVYTDYTLRVMMYLALKYEEGGVATIDEMARAYGISRSHLTKIVNELSQHGFIETTRGRSGGARLARQSNQISVGAVVRMAEKDFAAVECHDIGRELDCAIHPACNLRNGIRRAVDAFLYELDKMTLADTITAPTVAASLLKIDGKGAKEFVVPVSALRNRKDKPAGKNTVVQPAPARSSRRRRTPSG